MSKSYLKQLLTYINKVYDIGEKINSLKDKRVKSPVKVSTIVFVVLFGFMLQIRSFIGSDPHIILGQEMIEPKKDSSSKDEGEITGSKRLIKKLYNKYHHFADIIVADALYCKSTWIKEVLSIGMDALVRVKDERMHIVKDALALFKCREADKDWTVKENVNTYRKIKAWDDDNFQMSDSGIEVRFIKFIR